MVTQKDIIDYLDKNYNHKDSISKLSSNPKVKNETEVYDFDEIKKRIYSHCRSVDVLFIKKNLNLIEFKTGFKSDLNDENEKLKKENMILSIRLKAYESLHLLQTAIIDEIPSKTGRLSEKIEIVFCAVIDTNEPVVADDIYTDILSDAGALINHTSLKVKLVNQVMEIYRKRTSKHKRLFYDRAFVLYDHEFDAEFANKFK